MHRSLDASHLNKSGSGMGPASFQEQRSFHRFVDVYSQTLRKLIVFCGAGASLEAGFPDWDGLIEGLKDELRQPIFNQFGEVLSLHRLSEIDQEKDPWLKVELASKHLGEAYETAISGIIRGNSDRIPTFYREIWKLRISGLITMNLDGLASKGFSFVKSKAPITHTGYEAFQARNVFTSKDPTIIELHGNIDRPQSWVLRNSDFRNISELESYKQFLRGVFSQNLVLIYGLSEGDNSVTAQLRYLRDIKSASGEYFALKRWPATQQDQNNFKELGIQYIYIPEVFTWESGLESFIREVVNYIKAEDTASVVSSIMSDEQVELPDPSILMQEMPDTVRLQLARASGNISKLVNESDALIKFKQKYDWAINHASRVKLGSDNDRWLGHHLIEEKGSGNFGRVFSAITPAGNEVAVKIAHEAVRDNDTMLNSFRRGVQSMRRLSADKVEGVVQILDASELPPSIIMEFISGINLEEAINRELFIKSIDLVNVFKYICDIIFSCHTHRDGILHRDLRPQNIMIDGDFWDHISREQVKVLDFDLSWYEGATGQDYYMASAAALGYLAPEQLNPKSTQSARSALVDVYGLSMLFYFMLSKEHPQAAAPERTSWSNQVDIAVNTVYSKQWSILPAYTKQLIMDGAKTLQKDRPDLKTFIERLSLILNMLEDNFVLDTDAIIWELAYRSFGKIDLVFRSGAVEGITLSGVRFVFNNNVHNNTFQIEMDAVAADSAARQSISKYLSDALDKAREIARTIGEVDTKRTSVGQSRNRIVFSIKVPKDHSQLRSTSNSISKIASILKVK